MVKDQRLKNHRREAEREPETRSDDPIIRSAQPYLLSREPAYFPSPELVRARDAQQYGRQENPLNPPPLPLSDLPFLTSAYTHVTTIGGVSFIGIDEFYSTPPSPPPSPDPNVPAVPTIPTLAPVPPAPLPAPIPPTTTIYYGPSAPSTITLTPLSTVKLCTTNPLIQSFFRFSVDASSWCSTYLASLNYYTTPPSTDQFRTELGLPGFVSSFYYPRITNLGPFDRDDMLSACSCWYPWTASETTSTRIAIVVSTISLSVRSRISKTPSITKLASITNGRSQPTITGITSLQSALSATSTGTYQPENDEFLVRIGDGTSGSMKLVPMLVLIPIVAIVGVLMLLCTCLCILFHAFFLQGLYHFDPQQRQHQRASTPLWQESQSQNFHQFMYKVQAERHKPRRKSHYGFFFRRVSLMILLSFYSLIFVRILPSLFPLSPFHTTLTNQHTQPKIHPPSQNEEKK